MSLSDAVRVLRAHGLLQLTIAAAPCCDAELQCVTAASALAVAQAHGCDAVVCAIGPGIVGTGTFLGHGGLAVADAANAAAALRGRPVIAPRVSFEDSRDGIAGSRTTPGRRCSFAWARSRWPGPRGLSTSPAVDVEQIDVDGWRGACEGLPLDHMGRGPEDDPWFFAAAFAAGVVARARVRLRYSDP